MNIKENKSFKLLIIIEFILVDKSFHTLKEDFAALIKSCGFRLVSYENLTNGIVAIHTGFKL